MGNRNGGRKGAAWSVCGDLGGMRIEVRMVSDLKEYGRNARRITDAEVEYIAKGIREIGFVSPVVIEADGTIVCGHAAVRAAKKAGMDAVPCVIADGLTPEQVRAFRLADNKTAAVAIWDTDRLVEEFGKIADERFGMEGLGFAPEMFGEAETAHDAGNGGDICAGGEIDLDGEGFGEDSFDHECPHCGFRFNGKGGK